MAAFVQDAVTWTTAAGNKTAALTPAVGGLLVVCYGGSGPSPFFPVGCPISDNQGGTYSQIVMFSRSGDGAYGAVAIRDQLVAKAVSTTVTYTAPASDTGGGLDVMEWSGMLRTGADAARQAASQSKITTGAPAPIFGLTTLAANPIVGHHSLNVAAPGAVEPSGFTERQDVSYANPTSGLETVTVDSGQTLTTVSWTSTTATNWGACVVELDTDQAVFLVAFPILFPLDAVVPRPPIWEAQFFDVPLITGQTFPQEIDATVTTTATIRNQVNKILSATATTTSSIQSQVSKLLSATATTTATMARTVLKILSATAATTASFVRTVLTNLSATVTTSSTLTAMYVPIDAKVIQPLLMTLRLGMRGPLIQSPLPPPDASLGTLFNQALTATVTTTATIVRTVLKVLSATGTTTATIQKQAQKVLTATATTTATIAKTILTTLTATATSTASMVAQFVAAAIDFMQGIPQLLMNLTLLRGGTSGPPILKKLQLPDSVLNQQSVSATSTTTATIQKQVNKLVSATATTTATIVKQVNKLLSATSTTTATIARSVLKVLSATATTTATMTRLVLKALNATAATTASIMKTVLKTLLTTVTSSASLVALKVILKALTATVTTTATIATTKIIGAVVTFVLKLFSSFPRGQTKPTEPSSPTFDDPDVGGQGSSSSPASSTFDPPTPED